MSFPSKKAETAHEILPVLAERWSPRAFSEKEVEVEKLLRIFEAARWAPSSSNEQPWRFLLARKGEEHYDRLMEGVNASNQKWAWTAPVLGFTVAQKKFARNGRENKHRRHDIGLAMGNILVQAMKEGLYVHQMAGIEPQRIMDNFRLDPNEHDVVTAFVIGYFDPSRLEDMDERYGESERAPRSRKKLEDIVFGNEFGKKASWIK